MLMMIIIYYLVPIIGQRRIRITMYDSKVQDYIRLRKTKHNPLFIARCVTELFQETKRLETRLRAIGHH